MLREFYGNIIVLLKEFISSVSLSKLKTGEVYGFRGEVLGTDQLCNPKPNLVEGYYGKIADAAAAKRFGTDNLEKYTYWSWRSCGVANVDTILKTLHKSSGSMYELVNELANKGGYIGGTTDLGWKHKSLVECLENNGISAELGKHLSTGDILLLIERGAWVIASIKSRITKETTHMVLLTGFTWQKEETQI